MLHLLSRSHPLSNVICAQGFEATAGPGHYDADVFVCGSPNVFESAFIGVFASSFAELHADLAQLAVDKFVLKEKDDDIVVMEENKTNFATFGHLYVVLVFVDMTLLLVHLEGQQGLDNESFPGHTALWNAYNPEVDGFATTPPQIVHALFAPLAVVVTQSLALLVVVLVAKYVYYRRLQARQESDAANAVAVVDFDNIDEHLTCPSTDHRTSKAPLISRGHVKNYSRLPLEELLRTPARANSLVRCHFDIDVVEDDGLAYMPPHVYYAFGVLVTDAGFLRTRRGFPTVIHRRIDVEKFFAPSEKSSTVSPSPLKRQQHPSTRIKFALKNVPTTGEAESENHSPSPPRTLSEFKSMPMAKSMRRRKSMEELLKSPSSSP
ncbi:hypothetical protein PInf_015482 [Phytophthora infestans]|nr:hypothetical protein PInf_015482 [Phytophthora infestans]